MRVALSLLALPALAAAQKETDGGWSPAVVTPENTKTLTAALAGANFSKSVSSLRVCWSEIASVCTQVVSGTNYLFDINGCSITPQKGKCSTAAPEGKCSSTTLNSCTPTQFQVKIYEQTWTNTLQVLNIVPGKPSGNDSMTCQLATAEQSQ